MNPDGLLTALTATTWTDTALEIVRELARAKQQFTIDDLRNLARIRNLEPPPNHGEWGGLMLSAVKEGIIKATQQYKPSRQKSNNGSPRRIWESLLFKQ